MDLSESAAKIDPILDPCAPSPAYTDTNCGHRLTAERQVADAIAKEVKSSYSTLPQASDIQQLDDLLDKTVDTMRKCGCYGLAAQPPNNSLTALENTCQNLAPIAQETFLSIETEIKDYGSYSAPGASTSD